MLLPPITVLGPTPRCEAPTRAVHRSHLEGMAKEANVIAGPWLGTPHGTVGVCASLVGPWVRHKHGTLAAACCCAADLQCSKLHDACNAVISNCVSYVGVGSCRILTCALHLALTRYMKAGQGCPVARRCDVCHSFKRNLLAPTGSNNGAGTPWPLWRSQPPDFVRLPPEPA